VRQTLLNQAATDTAIASATPSWAGDTREGLPGRRQVRRHRLSRHVLAQLGMSTAGFEAQERRSMQVQHLTQSLQISDFLTASELKRIFALENEQREVRYAVVPVARYAATATVDEAAIKAWYDGHAADYQNPESVRLQYAEMRLDDITREVAADAQGLQAYYEANKSRYAEEEKRHASHILIKVSDAVPDAAALKKAQDLRAQLESGKDFATLARQNSEDRARLLAAAISAGPTAAPT
jgi:peptidyl-prolyl cis-trans isomerase D